MMSLIKELITAVVAAPTIIPIAISIAEPLKANALKTL